MIQDFKKNGFIVGSIGKLNSIYQIENLIKDKIESMRFCNTNAFRETLLELQNSLNASQFIREFIQSNLSIIRLILGEHDFSHTSVAYLRGVRPTLNNGNSDFLGYHRERFYSDADYAKHQINIHIPLFHYDETCCMKYIPNSHLIPDDKIFIKKLADGETGVSRGSIGHKLGLTYAPKLIQSGVDFSIARNVPVSLGQFMIFSTDLIHGGGINSGNQIRFSSDFGLIANNQLIGVKEYSEASYQKSKKPYIPYYD